MDQLSRKTIFEHKADHYIISKRVGMESVVVALTPVEMHELASLYLATGIVEAMPFPGESKKCR